MTEAPLLTISVPTYQRVDLLERCLASLLPAEPVTAGSIELVVNDNSTDSDTEKMVERFARGWRGALRYFRNPPGTGAVGNFNCCIERAKGRYNLMLHDDDYLLPGGLAAIVHTLQGADHDRDRVLLFGVDDVDLIGNLIRRRRFRTDEALPPPAALERVLGNSSFVRVPGLVVQNASYRATGGFQRSAGTTCDFHMAVQLFARFGVRCLPQATAAYTVHPGGITTTVFRPRTIGLNLQAFDAVRRMGILEARTIDRLQRRWFHQFILAGTWRSLKIGDREAARQVYALFDLPAIRQQGVSLHWLPARAAFATLSGALWQRRPRSFTAVEPVPEGGGALHPDGEHGRGCEPGASRHW